MFELWSDLNKKAQKELKPDLGLRSWDRLKNDEKDMIWRYMNEYFFIHSYYRARDIPCQVIFGI